ncbi:hypothetical protein AVEN_63756-1 [Araneus ventricosus]|uniref:Uncharacterized protein n=1 Tax=Araneus ventricosus TaxID=182803 RepID=A0A4Y2KUH0_ARAVE|nr:hypothetical protein AVEN_63756-1 [Araneus ventricosus]
MVSKDNWTTNRTYLRSGIRTSPLLRRRQPPQTGFRRCKGEILRPPGTVSIGDRVKIRSMRSFALITSNTKSGRLSRSSYTKETESRRCCGVASIMLNFVQILNFLSPRENLKVCKCPDDK